jgi:hypothetical protein
MHREDCNHLNQELVITTGALEAMIVNYQCIFPSLPRTASCYHTLIISTSSKAKIPVSYFFDFSPDTGYLTAKAIVRMAVENFKNRNPQRVLIPGEPVPLMSGFSNEAIKGALGGSFKPLIDLIAAGKIRGAVGIVADPSYNALSVARESAAPARQLGIGHIILVVNRVSRPEDRNKGRERAGRLDEFSRVVLLSYDSGVIAAEPEVYPLMSTESDFMHEIKSLAETISHTCEVHTPEFP